MRIRPIRSRPFETAVFAERSQKVIAQPHAEAIRNEVEIMATWNHSHLGVYGDACHTFLNVGYESDEPVVLADINANCRPVCAIAEPVRDLIDQAR